MAREKGLSEQVALADAELAALADEFRSMVDIQNRKYGFPAKTYPNCFVGEEAVARLIETGMAADVEDAVRLGNLLMSEGIFHHVQRAHNFKDEYLFYRFAADEDHGGLPAAESDRAGIRWTEFLGTAAPAGRSAELLQPSVPEPDAELAEMAQVCLEEIGMSPLDEHNAQLLDNVHPKSWRDPEPKEKYNLVVIGAGAGGLVSAAGAAGVGARVALVESHLLGGDCLNVGCVPSKALLACAKAAAHVRDAHQYGVRIEGEVRVDFGAVMERMRRLRAHISPVDSAMRYADQLGVDVFQGRAKFVGTNRVEVNGKELNFAKAVIATGGTAALPNIPGLREVRYLTNSSIFNLTELPARLGVIGVGPIGMELAQAFQRFGSQVTVFSRSDRILPKEDREAAELVRQAVEGDGVEMVFHAEYRRIEDSGDSAGLRVILAGEGGGEMVHEFDALLVATGRKPAVSGLGLEAAGVEFDGRKGVLVNDQLQTSNPDIFAVGDVAGRYQFTHMADFMARLVIKNALFFGRDKASELIVPWATYTDPEVAHVGLYERDLKERNIAYTTYSRHFSHLDRAIVDGRERGFVKIHVAKGKGAILGATIVGAGAGDMISEITLAMQSGTTLGSLASVIHPYPTMAEAIRQCGDAYNRDRLTPTIKSIFHNLMALRR